MNKTIERNVNDLKLLIDEDLVEHEDIRSFGLASEDNYIINPKNVIQEAIELLKEYDVALRMMVCQYCVDSYESAVDTPERFNHSFMSAGETAFKVLGIENGEEVPEDFIWS